jgi:hypothetical protein
MVSSRSILRIPFHIYFSQKTNALFLLIVKVVYELRLLVQSGNEIKGARAIDGARFVI